jgi:hypothetical protein
MPDGDETRFRTSVQHVFESDRSQKLNAAGAAAIPVVTSSTPPPPPPPPSGAKAKTDS